MPAFDRKIFITLCFSLFVAVTGVGIVVPLLPVYAHTLGAAGIAIGLIFGSFSLSRTALLPFFGRLSDRKGRKPFIITGLLGYAFVSVAFMFSSQVVTLILIRFLQGIASAMMMPAIQAYVGDITPAGREGLVMGVFNMSVFSGLSLGPLAGGVINDWYGLNAAFGCMGVLAFIGFLLSVSSLPAVEREPATLRRRPPVAWGILLGDREISGYFLLRFAYTACIGIIWGFMPVFAEKEFHLTSSAIGILVMLGVLISGALHTPMGFLSDRINRKGMIVSGGLLAGYGVFFLQTAAGFQDLVIGNILFGIGGGISMPALMALVVLKGSETGAMGSVMALLTMGHSMGMLAGSILAGVMMDLVDLRQAFLAGAGIMLAGIVVFLLCTRRRRA